MNYIKRFSLIILISVVLTSMAYSEVTLVYPPDSSDCVSITTTFEWEADENQVSYELQIGYDSSFNFVAYRRAGLLVTTHEALIPFSDSAYYWRVKAYDEMDNEVVSDSRMFKTKKSSPEIIFPDYEEFCVPIVTQVIWSDIAADSYEFIVYSDSAMTDTVINKVNLQDTSYTFTLPEYNHTYFWTVNGMFDGCESEWAEVKTFTTMRAPASNFMPGEKATGIATLVDTSFRVRFQWDHIDTNEVAEMFWLQVSDTSDFSRFVIDTVFTNDKREIVLFFPELYNQEYFWRVGQMFDHCFTDWSEATSFKIQYEAPKLQLPADSSHCEPIVNMLRWLPSDDASSYTVQISDTVDFRGDTVYTFPFVDSLHLPFDFQRPMTYFYWRVRADDDDNVGLWSETFFLMTKQSTPEPVYPQDNTQGVDRNLTVRWTDKGSEANYDLILAQDEDFEFVLLDKKGITSPEYYFQLPEFNMNYYWKIRVAYSDSTFKCNSEWSDVFTFRTQLQAPDLISPADSSEDVPLIPRFEWSEVETAEYYDIAFSRDPSMEFIIIYRDSIPNTYAQITSFKFNENESYYWSVRATNSEGRSMWSEPFLFTTGIDIPEIPMLISPVNGSKKLPIDEVELVWHKEIRADEYRLQVYADRYFENGMVADTILTDTTFIVSNLQNFETYYWRVMSINNFGVSKYTAPWSFRTIDVAPTEAPVLYSPQNNAENERTELSLSWSEVPNAYGYEVQVATSESFDDGTFFENSRQNWDNVLYIYGLKYQTKYFWRVRAWSEAANGPWSDIFNFTTEIDVSVNDMNIAGFDVQIIPNPVNDAAELLINLNEPNFVKAEIYSITGIKVADILDRYVSNGNHRFGFDAANYPAGIYIIKINAGNKQLQSKFIVR